MGGLGKSSLAARICDRLPQFLPIVWVGYWDEGKLVHQLSEAIDSRDLRVLLIYSKGAAMHTYRTVNISLQSAAT